MVRSDTRSLTILDLFLKVTDHIVYGASESIEITSDFQRGDEEQGVWSNNNKQRYITSLRNRYPTGILIFVKDHENASLPFPPKSKIAPIWKCICEDTLTPEFREIMIRFYRDFMLNDEVSNEYKRILTKNGDNHTNSNKIDAIYTYMNTFG